MGADKKKPSTNKLTQERIAEKPVSTGEPRRLILSYVRCISLGRSKLAHGGLEQQGSGSVGSLPSGGPTRMGISPCEKDFRVL